MAVEIVTFGCRLNAYESEVMRGEAEKAGLGELEGGAIVVNTCAVTGEAVRQARQAIRKARRENPRPHHRHRLRGADGGRDLHRDG
jgi:threonylcarbamoyladenosine tRNA methylthiotransferase MtaB